MHFGFTPEQRELASLAHQVATDLSDISEGGSAIRDVDLRGLADTGLSGLLVSESAGGAGAGMVEGAILAEQLGRALAPAVVVGSFLISAAALELVTAPGERDELGASIASGQPCAVVVDADLSWPPIANGLAWAWHPDAMILAPAHAGLAMAKAADYQPTPTADLTLLAASTGPSRPHDLGHSGAGARFLAATNVLTSCLLLGHMRASLDLTVAYALDREQFGAKIGSFQAIKHLCADMLVDTESSHSIAYGAAAMVADSPGSPEARRAAAAAKAWCGDAAVRVCEAAIQVHGGVGFTWEFPLHRYLRSAQMARASFMGPAAALDLVAELDR